MIYCIKYNIYFIIFFKTNKLLLLQQLFMFFSILCAC